MVRNTKHYVPVQLDWEDRTSGRHRFIALGEAFHLVRTMLDSPEEKLETVIRLTTGNVLPPRLLEAWREIVRIRNQGSHVRRLGRQDYERVLQAALNPETIGPLLKIKEGVLRGAN